MSRLLGPLPQILIVTQVVLKLPCHLKHLKDVALGMAKQSVLKARVELNSLTQTWGFGKWWLAVDPEKPVIVRNSQFLQ